MIVHTEKQAPYSLLGDLVQGDYIPWHPEAGNYILEISTYSTDNSDEPLLQKYRYEFTITENSISNQLKASDIDIFPNPSNQDLVNLELDLDLNSPTLLVLTDKQGKVKFSKTIQTKEITLDVNTLEPGYYILQIQTDQQVFKRVLIIN